MSENTRVTARRPGRWRIALGLTVAALVVAGADVAGSVASEEDTAPLSHDHHADVDHSDHDEATMPGRLARVRAATARFHRVEAAIAAGYELGWVNGAGVRIVAGCVAHPTAGAMGYHYFNAELMADDVTDALRPEVLVYAPAADGGLRLVAVEWVVRGPQSNPPGPARTPSVLGMDMHVLVPPPGPAFFLTHAWVWADNPSGMFADWNPEVSCG